MFNIIRLHENSSDPVYSVIIGLSIFMIGVCYYIYYIMSMAFKEMEDE